MEMSLKGRHNIVKLFDVSTQIPSMKVGSIASHEIALKCLDIHVDVLVSREVFLTVKPGLTFRPPARK